MERTVLVHIVYLIIPHHSIRVHSLFYTLISGFFFLSFLSLALSLTASTEEETPSVNGYRPLRAS